MRSADSRFGARMRKSGVSFSLVSTLGTVASASSGSWIPSMGKSRTAGCCFAMMNGRSHPNGRTCPSSFQTTSEVAATVDFRNACRCESRRPCNRRSPARPQRRVRGTPPNAPNPPRAVPGRGSRRRRQHRGLLPLRSKMGVCQSRSNRLDQPYAGSGEEDDDGHVVSEVVRTESVGVRVGEGEAGGAPRRRQGLSRRRW